MEKRTIGAFIAVLRKANGMTQQQVADRLNVSNKTVSKWECDETLPDLTLIPALAEMFHVTCDELLNGRRMEAAPAGSSAADRASERAEAQTRVLIARTMNRHLNLTVAACALLAAGLILLFTVSYAFYRPVLGFGIFLVMTLAAVVTGLLSLNTAKTALTSEEAASLPLAHAAESKLYSRTKKLIAASVSALIWALPFVLIRHDVYADSVVSFSSYLSLSPALAAAGALAFMAVESILARCWPALAEAHSATGRRLTRLYVSSACALLLVVALTAAFLDASSSMEILSPPDGMIEVAFANSDALAVYDDMISDYDQGGTAWREYAAQNMAARGLPWDGEITDADRDYLLEHLFLFEADSPSYENALENDLYEWAFCPTMQSPASLSVLFDATVYIDHSGETAVMSVIALALIAAGVIALTLHLRRRILRDMPTQPVPEPAPADDADDVPDEPSAE